MLDGRAREIERLDGGEVDEDFARHSYGLMTTVNRWLGGERVVRRFVADQCRRQRGRPLRVLDIGAGACDIPLTVARWARRHGQAVQFVCLEPCQAAADLARQRLSAAAEPAVTLVQQDVFEHTPDQPYDWATGSLFFHHLDDDRILALLNHLRPFVRGGVLLNDLHRSALHLAGARVLTATLPEDLRHDALLSIRRGFRPGELRQLLGTLPGATVRAGRAWLFRVWAVVQWEEGRP